jgi:carboxylate-amine ligase
VFDELPRTGVPDTFESWGEYDRLISQMTGANLIEDATKIWWDIRPSARFPTLEMRITDMCTRVDDAMTVAALFMCVLRMLYRLRLDNQRWRIYPRTLINENRWLAQRFGTEGHMVDFGKGRRVAYSELIDELVELIREDADALGCVAEVEHARTIVARGTSAKRQLNTYHAAIEAGASKHEALKAVVDMLIEETVTELDATAEDA